VAVINSLIKTTKAELTDVCQAYKRTLKARMVDDRSIKSCNQLRRQHNCLADAQQYILDREIKLASGLHDTPLLAIHGLITENKGAMAKVKQEFNYVYKSRILNNQSTVLLNKQSSLKRRHKNLIETQKYILGLHPRTIA
jgi:hypothetical protein